MQRFLREHGKTMVVAMITAAVTASAPTIAATVADYAKNADKVDGKHAVGAGASVENRKGKLVATRGTTGKLPTNILDLSAFQKRCKRGAVLAYARIDPNETLSTEDFSTTGVSQSFDCMGGSAVVMSEVEGVILVRFPGLMGSLNPETDNYVVMANAEAGYRSINVQAITRDSLPAFEIAIVDIATGLDQTNQFSIAVFGAVD